MGLVNEAVINEIQILERKLDECIEKQKTISVHMHTKFGDMHNIVIPEYLKVYDNAVVVEVGSFVLTVNIDSDNITYYEDEDSIVLQDDDTEIDIDF